MENKSRNNTIDFLRGIAVFAMILIHTNYYFLSNKTALFLWNYAQFAVPVFVFCSAYLFFRKPFTFTFPAFWEYLKKRVVRLLLPYYIFLIAFVLLNYLKAPEKFSVKYVWMSITTWGGVEIAWLVLLFLQFTLLMPILSYLYERYRRLFWGYAGISFFSTWYFLFVHPESNYRYYMWLPWSLLCVFAILFFRNEQKSRFYILTILISSLIYGGTYLWQVATGHSPSLYDNKYPPNILFLAYGVAGTLILIFLSRVSFIPQKVRKLIHFLSIHSYPLYFVHYIVLHLSLYIIKTFPFTWYTFFGFVFSVSVAAQWGYVKLRERRS